MKTTVVFFLLVMLLIPTGASASDVDEVVASIKESSPPGWQVRLDHNHRPSWTRGEDRCVKLELYGPALGGYKYYNSAGKEIAEKRLAHEAIVLWVTPKGFNTGWNFISRFFYGLTPWATKLPEKIGERNGVCLYALESYFWEHDEWREPSPEGTATAIFYPPPGGKTWEVWESDIKEAVKRLPPTTGSTRR